MNEKFKGILFWLALGLIFYVGFEFYLFKNPEKSKYVPDYVLILPIGYLVYLLVKKIK